MRALRRGLGLIAAGMAASAVADISPESVGPVIAPGYAAQAEDERGMWQVMSQLERQIANSNLLLRDDAVNDYVRGIVDDLMGVYAGDVRIYILRDPSFNASMAPNGMMIIHTGLLARMRNEAQLAAVLGHEAGHYLRRHSLNRWRSMKKKTAMMAVLSVGGGAATSGGGTNWLGLADAINVGIVASIMSYSRKHETEADAFGLKLMADAGYTPESASEIWAQVVNERKASAAARDKRYVDPSRSVLSSHPPSEQRQANLRRWAKTRTFYADPNQAVTSGSDTWRIAIDPIRFDLLREQIKMNNPGASLYLIELLAEDGWTSELRYFEGEAYNLRGFDGDVERAAQSYAAAVELPGAPAAAWRAHGYALQKAGDKEGASDALKRYLELEPDAPDAAMVRFSIRR
ncbi:MAG: M48 family metalloprotease [Gammaproteobacteria bacterium]